MLNFRAPISDEFIELAFDHLSKHNGELYTATDKFQWTINSILRICLLGKPTEMQEQDVVEGIWSSNTSTTFDPQQLEVFPARCRYEILDDQSQKLIQSIYVTSHMEDYLDFFTIYNNELLYAFIPKYAYLKAKEKKPEDAVAISLEFSIVDNTDSEDIEDFRNLIDDYNYAEDYQGFILPDANIPIQ